MTAMRGKKLLRKLARISSGVRLAVLHPVRHLGLGAVLVGHRLRDLGEAGTVGDLLAEVVALAELLACDADDVVGVGIVLGEDQGLRHLVAVREGLRQHPVSELPQHRADLALRDHVAVELVGGVGEILVEQLQPFSACQPVAHVYVEAGLIGGDGGALLGDGRLDAVHVEVDVHPVDHRLVVSVLHDEVLVEEADGAAGGGGGQADEEGVEVEEHPAPEVIDGTVALVDDDEVEELRRHGDVVGHVGGFAAPGPRGLEARAFLVV